MATLYLSTMKKIILITIITWSVLVLTAYGQNSKTFYVATPYNPPYPVEYIYPNGQKLKIISIKDNKTSKGDRWIEFSYLTDIDIDNRKMLIEEAKKIWPSFKVMADALEYKIAIMGPSKQSGTVLMRKTITKRIPIFKKSDKWEFKK